MLEIMNPLLRWVVLAELAFWGIQIWLARKERKRLKLVIAKAHEFNRNLGEVFTGNLLQMAHLHGYKEIESVTVNMDDYRNPTLKFGTLYHSMTHSYGGAITGEEWIALCERWRMTHRPAETEGEEQ